MTFNEYDNLAKSTRVYPEKNEVIYTALMLAGEVGEVTEKIGKQLRKKELNKDELTEPLKKELGDVLWYLSALAADLGLTLEEVAIVNIEKLKKRYEENKIHGDGDNR